MNFTKYIKQKGFKPYRKRFNRKTKEWEYSEEKHYTDFFSSMGDLDICYIKDDVEIIFGLHEVGKPPTLISPRPIIEVIKEGEKLDHTSDDAMNICLQNEKPKDIFKAMFDKTKGFEYNFITS